MMTEQEKSFIRHLVQSANWQVIEKLANDTINKIREGSPVRDNEWETIKTTLEREGKVEGIRQLLNEMYLIGSK